MVAMLRTHVRSPLKSELPPRHGKKRSTCSALALRVLGLLLLSGIATAGLPSCSSQNRNDSPSASSSSERVESGSDPSTSLTACVRAGACSIVESLDVRDGKVQLITKGPASVRVVLMIRGVAKSEQTYSLPSDLVTLDCVPIAEADVCLVDASVGVHHTRSAIFAVYRSAIRTIRSPIDSFGVLGLARLGTAHVLVWSWTSAAGVGNPDDTKETAWQTWLVSRTSLRMTGCGPRFIGNHAPDPPTKPLHLACP